MNFDCTARFCTNPSRVWRETTSYYSTMSSLYMPLRGERTAPIFDPAQPATLRQYFAQLDALFARFQIESEHEKKEYASSFLRWDTAEAWEALPQYSDESKTYADLKDRLLDLYNQSALRYTLCDLEQLVSEHMRPALQSLRALSEFHLRFTAISKYLLGLGLLSPRKQSLMYPQVFDESLRSRIEFRLHIQFPNHSPSLPHPIDAIFEAARWILRDPTIQNSSPMPVPHLPAIPTSIRAVSEKNVVQASPERSLAAPASNSDVINSEELRTILRSVSRSIMDAVNIPDTQRTSCEPAALQTSCATLDPAISAYSTSIRTPASIPHASAPNPTRSASLLIAPTAYSTPHTPLAVQTRIQAIEDELRTLRAQCSNTAAPITPNRSVPCPAVAYSPPTPLRSITPALSTPSDLVRVSSPLSTSDRLLSIVSPASFAYRGRLYQAVQWTSRTRLSRAPSIPATRTTAETPIVICEPSEAATPQILTSQPSETSCAANSSSISRSYPRTPAFAPATSLATSTASASLHSPSFRTPSSLRRFAQRSLRATLPYIRNHARLKVW